MTSTSPCPIAMFTLLPVRQAASSFVQEPTSSQYSLSQDGDGMRPACSLGRSMPVSAWNPHFLSLSAIPSAPPTPGWSWSIQNLAPRL